MEPWIYIIIPTATIALIAVTPGLLKFGEWRGRINSEISSIQNTIQDIKAVVERTGAAVVEIKIAVKEIRNDVRKIKAMTSEIRSYVEDTKVSTDQIKHHSEQMSDSVDRFIGDVGTRIRLNSGQTGSGKSPLQLN